MKLSTYACVALAAFSTPTAAFLPDRGWRYVAGATSATAVRVANKFMGPRAAAIVALKSGAMHGIDTYYACKNTNGDDEAQRTCAESIATTVANFCLSLDNFATTGVWSSSSGSAVKREDMLEQVDAYFDQFPDDVDLHDIKYHGQSLNHTHLPQSLGKRGLPQKEFRALHNASMPLSFVYHNKQRTNVPVLVATNGTHHHIGFLDPIDETNSTSTTRYMQRRASINTQFTHVGKGGVKAQCNSKYAPMTHTQVQRFMDEPLSSTYKTPGLKVFLDAMSWSPWIGFSFTEWVNDSKKNFLSGQWAWEVETAGFGSNFETKWNWCFGVHETNCPKDDL